MMLALHTFAYYPINFTLGKARKWHDITYIPFVTTCPQAYILVS